MKKYLLFLLITFGLINFTYLKAQTYYPLVDTNKTWLSLETCNFGSNTILNPYYIKFSEDTTINAKIYLKVFKCIDSSLLYWSHIGYIRDSLESKTFYKSKSTSQEGLLYDFNAEIGDTINIINTFLNNSFHPLIVLNIDSITLIDNSKRKRFSFTNSFNNEYWIEGIGSTLGILNSSFADTSGCGYELICFKENDSIKYLNPDYSTCNISDITNSTNEILNHKIECKIYPNPVTDVSILEILNHKTENCVLNVFDFHGSIIFKKIIKNKNNCKCKVEINKREFNSGIYFYEIVNPNKIITGKFIIY